MDTSASQVDAAASGRGRRPHPIQAALGLLVVAALAAPAFAQGTTHRLYDDIAYFFDNPDGREFTVNLEIRDINHVVRGPSETLVKLYDPQGAVLVREVIPDDGIDPNSPGGHPGAWDHDAFYYATLYGRGLLPAIPWSQWSQPERLAAMAKRSFSFPVKAGARGVYRLILAGGPNLYVTVSCSDAAIGSGVSGGPDWMHGHHDLFAKRFLYLPKGTQGLEAGILELDCPADRRLTITSLDGQVLLSADATRGMAEATYTPADPGALDDTVVVVEVSPGPHDYFLRVEALLPKEQRHWRGQPRSLGVLCETEAAARGIRNGALYHDGRLFWQGYQIRLYEWLKTLTPADFQYPADLPERPGFISVGSHQSPMSFMSGKKGGDLVDPKPGLADVLMHHYPAHRNRNALNAALREMLEGMLIVGPNDHVMHGRNLAYEMGTYSYFYHRPAWRILQQSDAPEPAKSAIREFIIQIGDRLAFGRGIELVNGNSAASLVQGLRYCVEASGDPLQRELFDTFWRRFSTGGFGDRAGIGPSGGIQEGYGYDYHYGGYVMRGWQAGIADLGEQRFVQALDGLRNLYSYVYGEPEMAAPWNSRTAAKLAGGVYNPQNEDFPWKGLGGPDITGSVNDANEFFYARRPQYYVVAYAGRITPSWLGESFHGQIGFSGGLLAQLVVPGYGQVLNSKVHRDYGGGMHPSQWRDFHLHSLVGVAADGSFIVTSYSEPERPRLVENTLRVDAEVSQSCFHYFRTYTFGAQDVTATVRLADSDAEKVFGIYGGTHGLRGLVAEAYEMIPFTVVKAAAERRKPPVPVTKVYRVDAQGAALGLVTREAAPAAGVVIEQPGYGVRLEFDRQRRVLLGNADTVMIELAARPRAGGPAAADESSAGAAEGGGAAGVPAAEVACAYRIVPFVGAAPAGPIANVDPAAAAAAAAGAASATQPGSAPGGEFAFAATSRPEQPLPVLEPAASLDAIVPALAGLEPLPAMLGQEPLAEIRFAVMGDQLAIDAMVFDAQPQRAATVWKGSELEVFGASPDASHAIAQVFLAPAVGDTPAEAFIKTGTGPVPEPAIRLRTTAADKGYRLLALIPLRKLGIDPAQGKALLEFQPGVMAGAAGVKGRPAMPRYATVFGSRRAYENSSRYGRFALGPR